MREIAADLVRLPEIALDIRTFSELWNHDRHFLIIHDNVVKLWGNVVVGEYDDFGNSTNRFLLCAVSFLDVSCYGLKDGFAVISVEILHTSSEYANHYGNCSVVLPKTSQNITPKWAEVEAWAVISPDGRILPDSVSEETINPDSLIRQMPGPYRRIRVHIREIGHLTTPAPSGVVGARGSSSELPAGSVRKTAERRE